MSKNTHLPIFVRVTNAAAICFGLLLTQGHANADTVTNVTKGTPFQAIEADITLRAKNGLTYTDRDGTENLKISKGEVREFQCQTVKNYLINEGITDANVDHLPPEEKRQAYVRAMTLKKSLSPSMLAVIEQKDSQNVASENVQFCLAEVVTGDDLTYTFAIPLENGAGGELSVSTKAAIVNISGFSATSDANPAKLALPSLDKDIEVVTPKTTNGR